MFFGGFFKCENDPRSERKEGGKEAAVVSLEKVPTFDALFLGDHSQMMFAMGSMEGYYPKTEEVFSTDENKIQNIALKKCCKTVMHFERAFFT